MAAGDKAIAAGLGERCRRHPGRNSTMKTLHEKHLRHSEKKRTSRTRKKAKQNQTVPDADNRQRCIGGERKRESDTLRSGIQGRGGTLGPIGKGLSQGHYDSTREQVIDMRIKILLKPDCLGCY